MRDSTWLYSLNDPQQQRERRQRPSGGGWDYHEQTPDQNSQKKIGLCEMPRILMKGSLQAACKPKKSRNHGTYRFSQKLGGVHANRKQFVKAPADESEEQQMKGQLG